MTAGQRAAPPTPEQILMFGHIAATLREALAAKRWKPGDYNQAMGIKRSNTAIYQFLNCRMAPTAGLATRMAKVLGVPVDSLLSRDMDKPSQAVTVHQSATQLMRPMNPNPVLAFTVSADGTARIKLDAAMSLATAAPLLRILLDAGIIPTGDNDGQ